MTRVKASFTHFLISVFVFVLFLSLVYFIWYAYPFNLTQGVGEIVYLMAGVDVVLGPLLTLIVFKSGKKSLKFDLSVIALVQIAALIYGAHVIYSERPAYIVHTVDRFSVVSLSEVPVEEVPSELQVGFLDKPRWIFAERAKGEEANTILFEVIAGGKDIDLRPKFYRDYKDYAPQVLQRAQQLTSFWQKNSEQESFENLVFLPINGKKRDIIALLDNKSAQVVDYIIKSPQADIKPNKQESSHE